MEWSHVTWRDGQHVSVARSTDETRGGATFHTHNAPADHTAICPPCQGTKHRLILDVIPKLAILTLSLLNISKTISLNYFAFPFNYINFRIFFFHRLRRKERRTWRHRDPHWSQRCWLHHSRLPNHNHHLHNLHRASPAPVLPCLVRLNLSATTSSHYQQPPPAQPPHINTSPQPPSAQPSPVQP